MGQNKRINKEIQKMMRNNDLYKNSFDIEVLEENNTHLKGRILGAVDTPFQYGVFEIDIRIPDKYPMVAPICKFITKLWHPNISSQTGVICLDILKDQWAAALTLESVLISLLSFLSSPVPDDPQDEVVAAQYRRDRQLYNRTAKFWTYTYAVAVNHQRQHFNTNEFKEFEDKIKNFMKVKGCNSEEALTSLSNHDWDLDKALK